MIASKRSAARRTAGLVLAVLAGLMLAVMPAASPSYADAADEQAAAEVAAQRCAQMRDEGSIPRQYQDRCEAQLADDLLSGRAGSPDWEQALCRWVPDLPLVGNPCDRLIRFMQGAAEQFQERAANLRETVDAITNPVQTAITNFTETVGDALESLLGKVFVELVHLSSPNIASEGFVSTYAAGAGVGMFVLVVMIALVWYRAAAGDLTGEQLAESMWRWVPTAVVLVLFGPGIGLLLVQLTDAASVAIVTYFAADIASLGTKITAMVMLTNLALIPGGPLMALAVMLVAFLGVIGIVGGLLVRLLALYLTGGVMAIAFVMTVDPAKRQHALRLPVAWGGLLLVEPLMLFLLGAVARISDSAFSASAVADDGMRALVTALVAALALLIAGVAPWTLLKFAPVLPDGAAQRMGRASRASSSGALGGAASSVMMQLSYRRMQGNPGEGGAAGSEADAQTSDNGPGQGNGSAATSTTQARSDSARAQGSGTASAESGTSAAAPSGGAAGAPASAAPVSGGAVGAGAAPGATAAGGGAAAGGAGTAAAAGATAATGGVAAAALIGFQVANAAKNTAEDAANRASDVVPGE